MDASGSFKSQPAPCGRIVDGENYRDQDSDVVVTLETEFTCGCRSIQHEYHDGTVSRTVIRHDGRVLIDLDSSARRAEETALAHGVSGPGEPDDRDSDPEAVPSS